MFSRAPRVGGVAPISATVAQFAKSASRVSAADREHAEAMARAKDLDGSDTEKEVASVLEAKSIKAKYKIEVYYGPNRTVRGPNVVQIQFFESGKHLHGGGDELMFRCGTENDPRLGCKNFIPGSSIRGGVAICPHCQQAIKATALVERLFGNKTSRQLADELARWFRMLNGSCDIYCKFDREDIRYLTMEKRLGSQAAHRLRGLHIYPLRNIIKDVSNGSSLEDRFFAFLTA